MMLCVFLIVFLATSITGEECDSKGILIYEDLGCAPIYNHDEKCPSKYFCTGLEPSEKYCYFRGRQYKDGETVNNGPTVPSCDIGCYCSVEEHKSVFNCAAVDCPRWLDKTDDDNCYHNISLDECCPVGKICPPFNNIQTCLVDGKEYKEGEIFYPLNTCFSCVCMKGFNGKFQEPFCRKSPCGIQLSTLGHKVQEACAPFYKQTQKSVLCCPDDWICPDGSEEFIGDSDSDNVCKFGNKTVKVGQQFEKFNFTDPFNQKYSKVICECAIPPLMKCTNV